ncbi:N4-gp56 family major capsid protein [Rhodoblastus acidophilus]|uniref:N4-gp56 family major capsid protein n=1 Tax=Rhodoblastus acidophilus TaxID=1074 RepID=A0A6N8DPE0_RHOAC|nr:N4-gp56 family major capsid protein [Rhodoblastus acidophilus]MCW2275136.1 N4-gp56 family major capsid protein [Rhodoblastus acidophilus]MTV31405.1 N4-gp56 family major capsid protein [Rhodoblastus acidophilus]
MTTTVVAFGDPKAQKKWSAALAVETGKKSYFTRKFIGTEANNIIQRKTELESDAGDRVSFDLSVMLRNKPTTGDNRVKGKEENLRFFTDEVAIDQLRHAVSAGGKMSRKRTAHDLRKVARDRLSDYWSQYIDELHFMYLSGARGINEDFIEPADYTGHAGVALTAPDTQHMMFGGNALSAATVDSSDKMSRTLVERAVTKARMMRALDPNAANMLPVTIGGEAHYVCIMTPFQEFDMRTGDTAGWLEIQKAAVTAEGRNNPIFKGGLGMINNVVLHSHESVIRFANYGADSLQPAARALFLGRQAAVVAYGSAGGLSYNWKEETEDYGNEPTVVAGTIIGVKKTRFNNRDFGVISMDTYSANPEG